MHLGTIRSQNQGCLIVFVAIATTLPIYLYMPTWAFFLFRNELLPTDLEKQERGTERMEPHGHDIILKNTFLP